MLAESTIVAISTPPGRAALAIVRLSGSKAREILYSVCLGRDRAHTEVREFKPSLGFIYDQHADNVIDEVVVTYFPKPHSYTGEDVVEISCHGSPVLARKIVEICLAHGAHLASPGEFTMRAFLNGKLDLAQAEAVNDLIEARTLYQARIATQQLEGRLSKKLQPIKEALIEIACHLESKVEFVEEDIQTAELEDITRKMDQLCIELGHIERSFEYGRLVHEGFDLAILGRPNVGKSSLFNGLLCEERAIVTEIPGTTRDMLAESIGIFGIPVRFMDTAGIREHTSDIVERKGIEKSLSTVSNAEIILLVIDSSQPLTVDDYALYDRISKTGSNYIIVLNKMDLPLGMTTNELAHVTRGNRWIKVSAKERQGLEELKKLIFEIIAPDNLIEKEDLIITNIRHKQCITDCISHLQKAREALITGLSEEFALYDFHQAHKALGEITGETTIEDLLTQIFSKFCIGK